MHDHRFSRRSALKGAAAGALAAAASSVPFASRIAAAGNVLQLRMATSWSGGALYDGAVEFAARVAAQTGGRIAITVEKGGVLGKALEVPATVAAGGAEMGHSWSGYDYATDPGGVILGGFPGTIGSLRQLHWFTAGDGAALWRAHRGETTGLVAMPMLVETPEVFLHAKTPITTAADLAGLKVRTSGVWSVVIGEFGATPVAIAQGDIDGALASGEIDAFEFGTPSMNLDAGWDTIPYLMLPGLHQPGSTFELTIAPAVWDELSAADRGVIERVARGVTYDTWTALGLADNAAMATFRERGVTVVDIDPFFRDQIRLRGREWVDQAAAKDPATAAVLAAYDAYRATWRGSDEWRGVDGEG